MVKDSLRRPLEFLSANDKLITWVAAVIVFCGFFIKDGARDRLKGLQSSLELERSSYSVHLGLSQIGRQLAVFRFNQQEASKRNWTLIKPLISDTFGDVISYCVILKDGTDVLMRNLPTPDAGLEQSRRNTAQEIIDANLLLYSFTANSGSVQEQQRLYLSFLATVVRTSQDIDRYSNAVVTEAEKQRDDAQRKLRLLTYLEYSLFIIGWGLGLLAKLAKIETVPNPSG